MNQEVVVDRCVVCKIKTYSRCSRCRSIYYCSIDHQRQDWKRHKVECKKLSKKLNQKLAADAAQNEVQETPIANKLSVINTSSEVLKTEKESKKNLENEGNSKVSDEKDNINLENSISNKIFVQSVSFDSKESDTEQDSSKIKASLSELSVISKVVHTDKNSSGAGAITYEGSSENEILSASTQTISSTDLSGTSVHQSSVLKVVNKAVNENMLAMPSYTLESPPKAVHGHKDYSESSLKSSAVPFGQKHSLVMDSSDPYYELCHRVIRDMSQYGVCVLDNFLGKDRGTLVLREVLDMYKLGIFQVIIFILRFYLC